MGAVSLGFPSQVNIDEKDNRFCLTDVDGVVSLTTVVQFCSVQALSWSENAPQSCSHLLPRPSIRSTFRDSGKIKAETICLH